MLKAKNKKSRGKDAVLVNKLINLKLNCFGTGVCKVGFPISALEKYGIPYTSLRRLFIKEGLIGSVGGKNV